MKTHETLVLTLPTEKKACRFLRRGSLVLGVLGAGWLMASPDSGRVTVTFWEPENFTDLRETSGDFDNERGREQYLPLLKEYLEQQAAKRLSPGLRLNLTFTDIDLAGDFEPWHGVDFQDIRIVKDLYLPRLAFRYQVTDASGQTVREGECRLVDGAFLMSVSPTNNDSLRFEKEMLDRWLRQEFPRGSR